MNIELLDVIEVSVDILEESVYEGMTGTVVEILIAPRPAYLVEFCNENGETISLPVLTPDQIRSIKFKLHEEENS